MRLGYALRAGLLAGATIMAGLSGFAAPAAAQIGSHRYAAIVVEARSGNALVAANADETRHPASLTKMMTLYMVFEALRDGRLSLDSRIAFSAEAASRPPSKLGIPAGHSVTVEQAILALVTRSANDVAAAVGERLGGSEARFAQLMTMRARALGMDRTTFRNASGLPDPDQVTTARDMATLGRRLIQDFPDRYHYFAVSNVQFGGVRIRNHNRMLESYEGVDGIKTGFINASGFNIVTSASRGGQRVVGAVFGGSSWVERDQHMAALLDRSFDQLGVAGRATAQVTPAVLRTAHAGALPRPGAAQARPVSTAEPARPATAARPAAEAPRSPTRTAARPATQPARATAAPRPATQTTRAAPRPASQTTRPAAQPQRQTAMPAPATTTTRTQATARAATTTTAARATTTEPLPPPTPRTTTTR
jgi:D-alanyl-D-alanine carboxypeptidase